MRQSTVIEELEQRVEHVGVSLFDLVKQNDAVRGAAHGLRQLPALPRNPRILEVHQAVATRYVAPCARSCRDGSSLTAPV